MAETATPAAPVVAPVPAPAAPPPRFANKFADVGALEGGIRSAREALSLPPLPDGTLIGTYFKDAAVAEGEYLGYQTLIGRNGKVTPAPAAPDTAAPVVDKPIPAPGPALNGNAVPEDLDIPQLIAKANLKIDDLTKKVQEKGVLDKSDYDAISKVHPAYTPKIVDQIIGGIQAKSAAVLGQFVQISGGNDQYEKAIAWGRTLPESDKQALNSKITDSAIASNPQSAVAAWKAFMFDYMQANPTAIGGFGREPAKPTMADGSQGGMSSGQPFATVAEYDAAERRQRRGAASQSDLARLNATTSQMLERMPVR